MLQSTWHRGLGLVCKAVLPAGFHLASDYQQQRINVAVSYRQTGQDNYLTIKKAGRLIKSTAGCRELDKSVGHAAQGYTKCMMQTDYTCTSLSPHFALFLHAPSTL